MYKINKEVTILLKNGQKRKAAFASFNRDLNLKHVDMLCERIKEKGFRKGQEIEVVKCEDADRQGVIDIRDINGNLVKENFENYYLVLDGQHRVYAVAKFNEWAFENGEEVIEIPANEADLVGSETIAEYINDTNITRKEWDTACYVKSAAEVITDNDLLQVYRQKIRSEKNPNGYPLSTLNLIYCNGQRFTKSDFNLLCSGITKKGTSNRYDVIPAYNIANGDKFIEICQSKRFKESEIGKRYLIKQFRDISTRKDIDSAFKVLEGITPNDYSSMTTPRGKLIEEKVISVIKILEKRILDSQTVHLQNGGADAGNETTSDSNTAANKPVPTNQMQPAA